MFYRIPQHLREINEIVSTRSKFLESLGSDGHYRTTKNTGALEKILNPARARNKGCGVPSLRDMGKVRKPHTCHLCKGIRHNRKPCLTQRQTESMASTEVVPDDFVCRVGCGRSRRARF